MLSSAGSVLLSVGAWSYIPDFASQRLLSFYHQFLSTRGVVPPRRGSPRWQRHYRTTYAIVVLAYLSYNLVETARSTPPNFYQILGVTPGVNDAMLRSSYRAFAKRYHPDRAGPGSESLFMTIQNAYESLKNPMKRFAYERFGPDALGWRNCSVPMDYLKQGIMQSSGFYIVSGGVLVIISLVGRPSPVASWRYMLLLSLFASELYLTAGPRSFGLLGVLFPDRVAFQHVLFLHHLFVFLSVALSRVIPVLFPKGSVIRPEDPNTYVPWLYRLEAIEKLADAEVLRLLHLELHAMSNTAVSSSSSIPPDTDKSNHLHQGSSKSGVEVTFDSVPPCHPPPDTLEKLTREMEDILVEQFVRVEPPLRALWDEAVRRLRHERGQETEQGWEAEERERDLGTGGLDEMKTERDSLRERYSNLPSPSPSLSPETPLRPLPLPGSIHPHVDGEIDNSETFDTPDDSNGTGSITPTGSLSSLRHPPSPSPSPFPSGQSQLVGSDDVESPTMIEDEIRLEPSTSADASVNESETRLASTAFIRVVERRSGYGYLESE